MLGSDKNDLGARDTCTCTAPRENEGNFKPGFDPKDVNVYSCVDHVGWWTKLALAVVGATYCVLLGTQGGLLEKLHKNYPGDVERGAGAGSAIERAQQVQKEIEDLTRYLAYQEQKKRKHQAKATKYERDLQAQQAARKAEEQGTLERACKRVKECCLFCANPIVYHQLGSRGRNNLLGDIEQEIKDLIKPSAEDKILNAIYFDFIGLDCVYRVADGSKPVVCTLTERTLKVGEYYIRSRKDCEPVFASVEACREFKAQTVRMLMYSTPLAIKRSKDLFMWFPNDSPEDKKFSIKCDICGKKIPHFHKYYGRKHETEERLSRDVNVDACSICYDKYGDLTYARMLVTLRPRELFDFEVSQFFDYCVGAFSVTYGREKIGKNDVTASKILRAYVEQAKAEKKMKEYRKAISEAEKRAKDIASEKQKRSDR